ncbi:TPA: AAA family ATPase, partial [Enterococcus faecium]|nr:AAA family ATPase [Enterococcus faecium]
MTKNGDEQMKTTRSDYIANLINKNIENSNSSGKFRKTVFHVHTPESHDYKLIDIDTQIKLGIKKDEEKNKNSWREFTSEELIKIAKHIGLLFENHLITDIKKYLDDDYFNSENELLAFLIQGHIILKEKIEVCLVCDHNSTKGFKKLQRAIYILRKERPDYEVKPRIELGIEISCSDKNHVVGILNQNNQEQLNAFNKWMNKNIISPSEGTIRTTFDVFEIFKKLGIIGYIAHINTSQIFKPEFLSGTYKKELFNSKLFKIIGVTKTEQISDTINRIQSFTKKKFNFIIDNDSHDIEGLRTNYFYIKGNKMNFNSIEAALKDFDLSVSYEKITDPSRYIKAIYIEGNGFLKGESDQHMILNFSPNFNAIIGGRGTGKSTILNTIGYLTSQIFENKNTLTNILNQGTCCVVYHFNGVDYYIFLFSSDDINNDIFVNNYFEEKSWKTIKKNDVSEADRRKRAITDRIQVFTYDGKKTTEIKPTKKILDELFTRKFTINELVNISSNESYLTQFIQSTIYEFKKIKRRYYRFEFKEGIEGVVLNYNNIPKILEKRMKSICQVLEDYNQENSKKLRINFRQKKLSEFPINWYSALGISIYSSDRYFNNYAITYENLATYLEGLTIKMSDGIEVCNNFWEKNYETILQYLDPINYFEELKIYN